MPNDTVRVIIADDHALSLSVFAGVLRREFDVLETVKDGYEAVMAVQRLKPDVVVLDIDMPVMNGLDAAKRIVDSGSTARIIFLTIHADADYLKTALSLGAAGYVLKLRAALDLRQAVRMAMLGQSFVSPGADGH